MTRQTCIRSRLPRTRASPPADEEVEESTQCESFLQCAPTTTHARMFVFKWKLKKKLRQKMRLDEGRIKSECSRSSAWKILITRRLALHLFLSGFFVPFFALVIFRVVLWGLFAISKGLRRRRGKCFCISLAVAVKRKKTRWKRNF